MMFLLLNNDFKILAPGGKVSTENVKNVMQHSNISSDINVFHVLEKKQ